MIWDRRGVLGAEGLVHRGVRLGGARGVLQAAGVRGLPLDPGALGEDGLAPAVVDVGGGEAATALMRAGVVVALDEGAGLPLEGARQGVVLEQGEEDQETVQWTVSPTNVLERWVPALDLAPRVRGCRGARPGRGSSPGPRARWPDRRRWCSSRCRSSRRGRCRRVTGSSPEAARARSSVAVTSAARRVAQSFQATTRRETSSSTVEREHQPQPVTLRWSLPPRRRG